MQPLDHAVPVGALGARGATGALVSSVFAGWPGPFEGAKTGLGEPQASVYRLTMAGRVEWSSCALRTAASVGEPRGRFRARTRGEADLPTFTSESQAVPLISPTSTFNSSEFQTKYSVNSMSNQDFVTFLYQLLVFRKRHADRQVGVSPVPATGAPSIMRSVHKHGKESRRKALSRPLPRPPGR